MKKILKRLGIFGLLLAVLIPFLDLPVVKAATDGCRHYLNTYLFLDVFNGNEIDAYDNGGHRNYTAFKYSFIENAEVEKVEKALTFNSTVTDYNNFYEIYKKISDGNTTSVNQSDIGQDLSMTNVDNLDGVTYLAHGKWAEADSGSSVTDTEKEFQIFTENTFDIDKVFSSGEILMNSSIQKLLSTAKYETDMGIALYNKKDGTLTGSATIDSKSYGDTKLRDTLNNSVLNDINSAKTNGYVATINNEESIIFGIDRKITNLDEISIGYKDPDGTSYRIFDPSVTADTDDSTSYDAFLKFKSADDDTVDISNYTKESAEKPKFLTDISALPTELEEQAYYWPEAYNIYYKVCDTTSTKKASLIYEGNTDDDSAKNVPATQSYDSGEKVTIQAGATRDKYVFKKWCTEKNGTGTCYVENDTFNITTDTTLYAQWGEEGTTENKKTGIASYIIGFASVGIVASGIYLISKKKNLFKQI